MKLNGGEAEKCWAAEWRDLCIRGVGQQRAGIGSGELDQPFRDQQLINPDSDWINRKVNPIFWLSQSYNLGSRRRTSRRPLKVITPQDILVDCPGGQINFKNRRVGNGVLDTDSRGDVAAVENVCWETPDVGVFKVHLKNFTAG